MANYSKEELQYIASQVQPYLLELVKSNGLDVDSIEVVEDTDGITSLPAYDNRGGTKKVVRVPLSTFSKPAEDAAAELADSIAAATEAASNANTAADNANAAADGIEEAKNETIAATESALRAVEDSQSVLSDITEKMEEITSSEASRVEAEQSREDAENSRVTEYASLKEEMAASIEEMDAATESALDTAEHPTYIGDDNYVYVWDKTAQAYNKTSIYVRGEGFSISKTYKSVAAMEADTEHWLKEGDFVLINTDDVENPDNAKIYVVDADGSFTFLVDMSGAIGFTGKTPQMLIGTVTVGNGKESAAVTLTSAGTDDDGNPKYNINYVIPCLAYEDLTEEQIADLQRPASDMIAQLLTTDESVKNEEALRVSAENERKEAEQKRIEAESLRVEANNNYTTAENERVSNENSRIEAEASRVEDYSSLREGIVLATEDATNAAKEAKNLPKIQNGTWWLYDIESDTYVDSGYAVSSDYQLTKEKIEGVFQGDIQTHWHSLYTLSEDLPTKVSELENDSLYVTETELSNGLSAKQDTIEDLDAIREGSSLGATALQSIPSEYITETELDSKGYATEDSLEEKLGTKQEKNMYFNDITVSDWVEDATYEDFAYRADIACEGVTDAMYAEVIFGMEQFTSPDYAPICETDENIVSVWAAKNDAIVIPTIIVYK